MKFRKTTTSDIKSVMEIITQAQKYFKENGIDQWQNNYPTADTISDDITNNQSYVLIKDDTIVATVVIAFINEKYYEKIYEGSWKTDGPYAVIHRIAVSDSYKGTGISSILLKEAEQLCMEKGIQSIRVDTHEDNKSMQRLLQKNNYIYCGVVYLEHGPKRIAFEKMIHH